MTEKDQTQSEQDKKADADDNLDWVETYGVNTEDFIPPKNS